MPRPPAHGHHLCPGRCGREVPNRLFACPSDWARLPDDMRKAILANAPQGGSTTARRVAHTDAMIAARDWLIEHPGKPYPDARIAGECEHCGAQLLWLTTGTGARMPVNADPDPGRGNVIRIGKTAGVLGPGAAASAREAGKDLWLFHGVTCPHADRWRNKRKPAAGTRRAGAR